MSYEEASLVEPLSCCFNAWKDLHVTPEDRVLVLGTGPIAGLFLQLARAYGARQAIVVGPPCRPARGDRVLRCHRHGQLQRVRRRSSEVMRLTGGHGVDVALTCAPAPELQGQAIACLARFGRMNFFSGLTKGMKAEIDTNKVHYWSLKLLGSTGSSLDDYARALTLVETGKIRVTGRRQPPLRHGRCGRSLRPRPVGPGHEDRDLPAEGDAAMRAAVLHAPGDLRVEDVAGSRHRPDEVLVRVMAAGICGSDIGRVMVTGTYRFPTIPGHEFAGRVEARRRERHSSRSGRPGGRGASDAVPGLRLVQGRQVLAVRRRTISWGRAATGPSPSSSGRPRATC